MGAAVSGQQYRFCRRSVPITMDWGVGEEEPHPELPGLVSVTANVFYARHFFSSLAG